MVDTHIGEVVGSAPSEQEASGNEKTTVARVPVTAGHEQLADANLAGVVGHVIITKKGQAENSGCIWSESSKEYDDGTE